MTWLAVKTLLLAVLLVLGGGAVIEAVRWLLARYRRRDTADILKWTNERRTMLIDAKRRQDMER